MFLAASTLNKGAPSFLSSTSIALMPKRQVVLAGGLLETIQREITINIGPSAFSCKSIPYH